MLKRSIRWLIPLLILAAIAIAFIVTPMIVTHAATTSDSSGTNTPDIVWPTK